MTTSTLPAPVAAPVLSTPESNLFEDPTPAAKPAGGPRLTPEEVWDVYEVGRTAREIIEGGWRRVALQFPDGMLMDAPRVYGELERELEQLEWKKTENGTGAGATNGPSQTVEGREEEKLETDPTPQASRSPRIRLAILADTSYGSCCVDEIAAEHVAADVVVHYGRACLSPTARLPVIYVYTTRPLDPSAAVAAFEENFTKEDRVVVMADLTYHNHVEGLVAELRGRGWEGVRGTEVIHEPTASIPNRKMLWSLGDIEKDTGGEEEDLKSWKVFHVSQPPAALLLTLSSRIQDLLIYPTETSKDLIATTTTRLLSRRYALLLRLTTTPIIGILINTLSVSNYLSSISHLRSLIAAAGKKSYTFVVGKVNSAKIANFAEVGGWVVVGCWESSLVEGEGFYAPVVTPFELGVALEGDEGRVWSGEWRGDFEVLEERGEGRVRAELEVREEVGYRREGGHMDVENDDEDSEEESAPPEFDLRTGRYVSHSRPLRNPQTTSKNSNASSSQGVSEPRTATTTLARRAKLEIASVNGAASPGAEFLRSQRTWTGLGSDLVTEGESAEAAGTIEEGRRGIARGYVIGEEVGRK
ncbi:putative Diphthamide biosynthesis protein 2 [Amylocarpus encephaloides]|uniref:2-(3-amino-3-carboxypropyl)histidine synthase subunit 2 n=1 Tax=Amylocarpus encephaloides TaxID=45428 RepID=A0A9P7YQQ4_9HELO|nr:putative Diphthamide biosynthesis protein 2 [Amylocarpus encephaloides]